MDHFLTGLIVGFLAALINLVIFLIWPIRARVRELEKAIEESDNDRCSNNLAQTKEVDVLFSQSEVERLLCAPVKKRRTMFTDEELRGS